MAQRMAQNGCAEADETNSDNTHTDYRPAESEPFQPEVTSLNFLKDDVYIALADHFLRQNKGRRPNLPPVSTLTNGLLIQFNLIKEQADCSFRELKTWIEKLFPDILTVTESRITHRIKTILDLCRPMSTDNVKLFMLEAFNFHALSPPLAALGLNRQHLTGTDQYTPDINKDITITNEVVVHLDKFRNFEHLSPVFVRKWVRFLCKNNCTGLSDSMIRSKVQRVLKTQKLLSDKKKLCDLHSYLSKPFFEDDFEKKFIIKNSCGDCKSLKEAVRNGETVIEILEKEKMGFNLKLDSKDEVISQQRREVSLLKCQELKIIELNKVIKQSKKTCGALQQELESVKKSKLYKKNTDHKVAMADLLKDKIEIERELESEKLKSSFLSKTVKQSKSKLKHEQTMKSKYRKSLNIMAQQHNERNSLLACDDEDEVKLRVEGSSHRYTDELRKTFYALQGEASVAAGKCSKVVETVAKHLFNKRISKEDLPCPSTSVNFSHEAHVLAKHHATSEIIKAHNFTYASDGTSRQKAHYLEQHIILADGRELSLGFSEIASDDSETLLEKCVALFKDLCEVYCLDEEDMDGNKLLKDVIRKMTALLSDRAAVNKAFNAKMVNYKEELLGGEDCSVTHFIFCNAHFLLALSSAAENAILCFEKEVVGEGVKLGRDSLAKFSGFSTCSEGAAVRLIRTAAEVLGPRGDEKNGCRQEWLAFCSSRGVKSTFTSFRNNRFNNLFQNSSAIMRHRHDILQFLNEYVSHSNLKLQSVVADLEDERIITSISVLSFLHVCLTEPYWRLMNSSKSYSDFPSYVQKMKHIFGLWMSDDFYPNRESIRSVFSDDEFKACASDIDIILNFVNSGSFDHSSFISCLHYIILQCDNALSRQLSDFLEGGSFCGDLADDVRNILSTCPLTNLTGERLFGDLDYCMNKRRNASLILRSTTNMWKHNQTARWLNKQNSKTSQKLIERAIKYGPQWKKRSVENKKAVMEKVQERIEATKRKKDEKAIKLAERKSAALDAILAEGGCVVSTKEQLDQMYSGPKAVDRIKDQIRFRSLVRGESITMTGNKKALYERLLHHITRH